MKKQIRELFGLITDDIPVPLLTENGDDDDEDPNQNPEEEEEIVEFYVMIFAVMVFFFITAALNERYKPRCGHQTSYAIILGVILSCILYAILGSERSNLYKFKEGAFFDFLLPPIILNSGFNMRRKKFFQNIGNIAIFGLGVTFFCFALYSVLSYVAIQYGDLKMINYKEYHEDPTTG